jgi:secreted trypsin-like serine protease
LNSEAIQERRLAVPRTPDNDPVYRAWLFNAQSGPVADIMPTRRNRGRVSFGADVPKTNYQEVVSLGSGPGKGSCSGVLLTRDTIVTAAHCFCENAPQVAVFGSQTASPKGQLRISDFRVPVGVKLPTNGNSASMCKNSVKGRDIALVQLELPAESAFSSQLVRVAPVTTMDTHARTGATIIVAGLGRTEGGRDEVKAVTTVPITNAYCADFGGVSGRRYVGCEPGEEFVSLLLDRTPSRPIAGPCVGDSGGPAYIVKNHRRWWIGVVSRGPVWRDTQCGDLAIYTRLTASKRLFLSNACKSLSRESCPSM